MTITRCAVVCPMVLSTIVLSGIMFAVVVSTRGHPAAIVFFMLSIFIPPVTFGLYVKCSNYKFCPLCHKYARGRSAKRHRNSCSAKNGAMLKGLPRLFENLRCPKCADMIPLWPRSSVSVREAMAEPFKCSGPACAKKSLRTEGFNQFTCFLCDYHLCLTCAHDEMQQQPVPTTQGRSITYTIPQKRQNEMASPTEYAKCEECTEVVHLKPVSVPMVF